MSAFVHAQIIKLNTSYDVLAADHAKNQIVVRGTALTAPYETYYRLYFVRPNGLWDTILIDEQRAANFIENHG